MKAQGKETRRKPKLYEGKEPYIFISYSHKDETCVWKIIETMNESGFRIWYDDGVHPGTEWDKIIADHIINASYFISFISENYLRSDNCKDELNFARDKHIKRLLCYLEKVELPTEMEMRLGRLQNIGWYQFDHKEYFFEKLFTSEGIAVCKAEEDLKVEEKDSLVKVSSVSENAQRQNRFDSAGANGGKMHEKKSLTKSVGVAVAVILLSGAAYGGYHIVSSNQKENPGSESVSEQKTGEAATEKITEEITERAITEKETEEITEKAESVHAENAQDAYEIAMNYKDGSNGYEKNEEEAIQYYKLVAEDESADEKFVQDSCWNLGYLMMHNDTTEDDAEAVSWWEKAAEKGDLSAIINLGWAYQNGVGVEKDYEKMMELYQEGADAGSSYAMNSLGKIYENGSCNQEKNLEAALKWYKMAAERDYDGAQESVQRVLQAMYNTARNYTDGKNGLEKNWEEALRYYKLVAEDESAGEELVRNSYFFIGWVKAHNDTEEDDAEAVSWFEKAIEKGDVARAVTNLGTMYNNGKGVAQDYEKAIELYKQASEAGEPTAMNYLGYVYENGGCGQKKNLEESLKWYKMAAEKNYDGAQESVERVQKKLEEQ